MSSYESSTLSREVVRSLDLAPDERLLWASARSGVTDSNVRFMVAGRTLGAFFVSSVVANVVALRNGGIGLSGLAFAALVLVPIASIVLGLAFALTSLLPRLRPMYFVTTRRLLVRKLFGGFAEASLTSVRGLTRITVDYATRYGGVQTYATDALRVELTDGSLVFGPSRDIDRVEELLHNAVFNHWVDLDMLKGLDAAPAPAEQATDFFICSSTRTGNDRYGPLFVGPRVIVRITEALPHTAHDRLFTLLGGAIDGEAAELGLFDVLRLSATGHFVELPRAGTRATWKGDNVRFESESGQVIELSLEATIAQRLRTYLARPVAPTSEPFSIAAQIMGASPRAQGTPATPVAPKPEQVPSLLDPTLDGSAARTLALDSLPATQMREMIAALGGDRHVAFVPTRFVPEHRQVFALCVVGFVLLFLGASTHFGAPCSPLQDASTIAIYTLGLMPFMYLLVAWARHVFLVGTLPFSPGIYVFPKDVVIARSNALRVLPLTQVAAVGAGKALPLSPYAPMTLWIECEPSETGFVPRDALDELVSRIDAEKEKLTRGDTLRDPLGELKRSTALENAPASRARSTVPFIVLAALLVAASLSTVLFMLRNAWSDRAALAHAGSDVEALTCYVKNHGMRASHVQSIVLPHAAYLEAHHAHSSPALAEFLDAYPHAADAPRARAEREAIAWAGAHDAWSLAAFIAAYPRSQHIAEAKRRLPALALEAARRQGLVSAYAQVMREHAGTGAADEARRLRHARYEDAERSLTEGTPDATAKRFFERLIAYLEAHDSPEVRVRFRSPSTKALSALDALLAADNEAIEPIAPWFTHRENDIREMAVYSGLRDGWKDVVPEDVLPLVHGSRLPDPLTADEISERVAEATADGATPEALQALETELRQRNDPPTDAPEIRIDYAIVPTGSVYELSAYRGYTRMSRTETPRSFAGFRINFIVELRLANEPERWTLRFSVTPPSTIQVGSTREGTREIYQLMCGAAFDGLATELRKAFMGVPSVEEAAQESE